MFSFRHTILALTRHPWVRVWRSLSVKTCCVAEREREREREWVRERVREKSIWKQCSFPKSLRCITLFRAHFPWRAPGVTLTSSHPHTSYSVKKTITFTLGDVSCEAFHYCWYCQCERTADGLESYTCICIRIRLVWSPLETRWILENRSCVFLEQIILRKIGTKEKKKNLLGQCGILKTRSNIENRIWILGVKNSEKTRSNRKERKTERKKNKGRGIIYIFLVAPNFAGVIKTFTIVSENNNSGFVCKFLH